MKAFTMVAATAAYATALKVRTDEDPIVEAILGDIPVAEFPIDLNLLTTEPTPMVGGDAAYADVSGDIVDTVVDAEQAAATLDMINAALTVGPKGDAPELGAEIPTAMPNNYRPPPEQDVKPRERRERPDIHDHGLLKSMDLGFVSNNFKAP